MLTAAMVTGLVAVTLAFADEPANVGSGLDNNSNNGAVMGGTSPSSNDNSSMNNSSSSTDSGSMDQGVSDTATGDDDY